MLRTAADAIDHADPPAAVAQARTAYRFLIDASCPHEQAEERDLYPLMNEVLGGADPPGTMTRAHTEILQLTRSLGRLLEYLDPADPPKRRTCSRSGACSKGSMRSSGSTSPRRTRATSHWPTALRRTSSAESRSTSSGPTAHRGAWTCCWPSCALERRLREGDGSKSSRSQRDQSLCSPSARLRTVGERTVSDRESRDVHTNPARR